MIPLHRPADRPLVTHQLPREVFDELCSGTVSEQFVSVVEAAQFSKRKLLLRALVDFCATHPRIAGPLTDAEAVWDILATAEERDARVVRRILTYPTVGVWATRILRKVHGVETDPTPVWSEFGYLHSLAAAAALRTGLRCHIRVPVIHGLVTLPTTGQLEVPTRFPAGFVDLHISDGGGTASFDRRFIDLNDPRYFISRHCHTSSSRGFQLNVEINDHDPYREFSAPMPPRRLDAVRLAEWRKMLDEAFDILTLWHPEYATELAAGLRVVTPLPAGGTIHGASSSAAIGSVAAAERSSATTLAETLVHEFQHSKLNGLLSLFDVGRHDNMYAPWRDDPRPLSGVLHGIFAFLSVAEFWRIQRDLVPQQEARQAHFTFALRRHQVIEAVESLRGHPALTPIGRQLVDSVDSRLKALRLQPVPPDLVAIVARMADDHRATWRSRHVRPDADDIARYTAMWLSGSPCPPKITASRLVPSQRPAQRSSRRQLLRLLATDPDTFAAVVDRTPLSAADAALLRGDHGDAVAAYQVLIRNDPADADNWTGLGLALRALRDPAADRILDAPEVVLALHNSIARLTGAAPDPVLVAHWLSALAAVDVE